MFDRVLNTILVSNLVFSLLGHSDSVELWKVFHQRSSSIKIELFPKHDIGSNLYRHLRIFSLRTGLRKQHYQCSYSYPSKRICIFVLSLLLTKVWLQLIHCKRFWVNLSRFLSEQLLVTNFDPWKIYVRLFLTASWKIMITTH